MIVSANDQERWRPDARERDTRQIRAATAGHDGSDPVSR
jgi:hypothetical protein